MTAYYNEHDPFAAQWLRNLIEAGHLPEGKVDERDIQQVTGADLEGFSECHFFAGIGGWPLALRLAGWPRGVPVWTGSCPCQPFSLAGKQKGEADPRHLWPEMFRLIRERRPPTIFGEQVASAIGHGWLDGVFADLEAEGYACGAVVLGAHSVGAPHIRQRLFWVADAQGERERAVTGGPREGIYKLDGSGSSRPLADTERDTRGSRGVAIEPREGVGAEDSRPSIEPGRRGLLGERERGNPWRDSILIPCRDGKARRAPVEPRFQPLVAGVSGGRVVVVRPGTEADGAREEDARRISRVGVLKGAGNAIVPAVAAEFIKAFLDSENAMRYH